MTARIPLFFNLVLGDYDVSPATVDLELRDDSTLTQDIIRQNNRLGEDGLIQAA